VTTDELKAALRQATIRGELQPVLCGSSLKHIGVQPLLDAVCAYLPAPDELPPVQARGGAKGDRDVTIKCAPNDPFAGLVFKIVAEKPVDLYFVRIYAGKLKPNSRALNARTGDKENVTRLVRMYAKRRDTLDAAEAGDIVAITGPRDTLTGDTLCAPNHPVLLESIEFPETVIAQSIEPASSRDRDKLFDALEALTKQDPTFRYRADEETGQTLIMGMGELHLEVLTKRIADDMNVAVRIGKPRVSYREAITRAAQGEGRFARELGGKPHFAVVRLRLEPVAESDDRAVDFRSEVAPVRAQPRIPGSDSHRGGRRGAERPADGLSADSLAGGARGRRAARDGQQRGGLRERGAPGLQPRSRGRRAHVDGTDHGRRGAHSGRVFRGHQRRPARPPSHIVDTDMRGETRIITVHAPLAEMFGYTTQLRSISQGRAAASMEPLHYAAAPPAVYQKMLAT
jgi:elongation factor G